MSLVYLDTETTGLDPARHDVWEIAWAVGDGPITSSPVAHSALFADPEALRLNGYHERARRAPGVGAEAEDRLREALRGATLVGANPAFDAAFLRRRWGFAPWRYRLLDVEAYAMGALGLDEPIGLAAIRAALVERGHAIPEPDHTAAMDVLVLREVHRTLRTIYQEGPRP